MCEQPWHPQVQYLPACFLFKRISHMKNQVNEKIYSRGSIGSFWCYSGQPLHCDRQSQRRRRQRQRWHSPRQRRGRIGRPKDSFVHRCPCTRRAPANTLRTLLEAFGPLFESMCFFWFLGIRNTDATASRQKDKHIVWLG